MVKSAWPGGNWSTRARRASGSSSEKTSSSRRTGGRPGLPVTRWWTRQPQGQGDASLLPLGRLVPGVPVPELQAQVVAVGPDGGHRRRRSSAPGVDQGRPRAPSQEPTVAAELVAPSLRRTGGGQARVGRRRRPAPAGPTGPGGRRPPRRGRRSAARPRRRAWSSRRPSAGHRPGAGGLRAGAESVRRRSSWAPAAGRAAAGRRRAGPAGAPGPPWTMARSSGEKTVTGTASASWRRAGPVAG